MPRCRYCKRELYWGAVRASIMSTSGWVDDKGRMKCDEIGSTHRVWLPQMANSIVVGVWLDAGDM